VGNAPSRGPVLVGPVSNDARAPRADPGRDTPPGPSSVTRGCPYPARAGRAGGRCVRSPERLPRPCGCAPAGRPG
jgi:hypothetical protein